jgi:hypothetical protein
MEKSISGDDNMLRLTRGSRTKMALGLIVGGLVGALIFWASALHGLGLFVLAGATAGASAGFFAHFYGRNVELRDVTITVPHLSELHFAVTPDSRAVAWQLFRTLHSHFNPAAVKFGW